MLAALYHGPNDLRVEQVPVPRIGAGELLVKVLSANDEIIGVTSDGGFAVYVRLPANSVQQGNVIPISDSVDPAVAIEDSGLVDLSDVVSQRFPLKEAAAAFAAAEDRKSLKVVLQP